MRSATGWRRVRDAWGADGHLELSVWDEGGRLPADFDLATGGGFGLSIVRGLAAELGGEARVSRDTPPRFVVTFPA